jgi:hypothetical protein
MSAVSVHPWMNRTSGSSPDIATASLGIPLDSMVLIEDMGELAASGHIGPMPNVGDQRLATLDVPS